MGLRFYASFDNLPDWTGANFVRFHCVYFPMSFKNTLYVPDNCVSQSNWHDVSGNTRVQVWIQKLNLFEKFQINKWWCYLLFPRRVCKSDYYYFIIIHEDTRPHVIRFVQWTFISVIKVSVSLMDATILL